VNGDVDSLEIACLWTDELGTSKLWYPFLNLGIPIVPIAGTDAFPNFYRCMTVGTTRVYVRLEEPFNWLNYLTALRKGLSFVTTGPLLDFHVDGQRPGEIVTEGGKTVSWNLNLYSATAVEKVEILVNGNILWSDTGLEEPGKRTYSGKIEIPEGGWIAARTFGGKTEWPVMDSYPFAHTAPLWIAEIGSTSPADEKTSARLLLKVLNEKEKSLKSGYEGVAIPKLLKQFQKAREILEARIQE
jgi:TolB protein